MEVWELKSFISFTESPYFNSHPLAGGEKTSFYNVPRAVSCDVTVELVPEENFIYRLSPYPFVKHEVHLALRVYEVPVKMTKGACYDEIVRSPSHINRITLVG